MRGKQEGRQEGGRQVLEMKGRKVGRQRLERQAVGGPVGRSFKREP